MTNLVKLDLYDNHNYKTKSFLIRVSWYFVSTIFFSTLLIFPSSFKSSLLRSFGAKIGGNVIIKPNVNIKYPWNLTVGNNTWIGEGVWIDNLTDINIGSNVCFKLNTDWFVEIYDLDGVVSYVTKYGGKTDEHTGSDKLVLLGV